MNLDNSEFSLFEKYNRAVPRYTSYPSVPLWTGISSTEAWLGSIKKTLVPEDSSWGLYLHMPFCESLCTFCGCTKVITADHSRETPYIDRLLKEFRHYLTSVPQLKERPLKFVHLGGGSPSFFSAKETQRLLSEILSNCRSRGFEGSIEVDPRRATLEQLKVLRELGFTRISLGVQDIQPEVQRLVNRHQPFEMVQDLTVQARQIGFTSVNFDLIYGLPKQSVESIRETTSKVLELKPDRIAFYSLAHVPWIKPSQRLFKDSDLASGFEKWQLYNEARQLFEQAGYLALGMDHFALPTDSMSLAKKERRLHRNFMGYTEQNTNVLLGLGMSAISESSDGYHQNQKEMAKYEQAIDSHLIPTYHGHTLTAEELQVKSQIIRLMTSFEVQLNERQTHDTNLIQSLTKIQNDGLLVISDSVLKVLPKGEAFVRVIAAEIDPSLKRLDPNKPMFSKSL